jgi:hypothetical protein
MPYYFEENWGGRQERLKGCKEQMLAILKALHRVKKRYSVEALINYYIRRSKWTDGRFGGRSSPNFPKDIAKKAIQELIDEGFIDITEDGFVELYVVKRRIKWDDALPEHGIKIEIKNYFNRERARRDAIYYERKSKGKYTYFEDFERGVTQPALIRYLQKIRKNFTPDIILKVIDELVEEGDLARWWKEKKGLMIFRTRQMHDPHFKKGLGNRPTKEEIKKYEQELERRELEIEEKRVKQKDAIEG